MYLWAAMVARTTTAPDEDKMVDKDTDDSVSDNQPASQSHVEEKVDEDVSLAPELEQKKETVVTTIESETIAVQWKNYKE
ncbi:hypothetical protein ACTQ6A_00620 [Lachnospiraceae bacterium LCP25S3_G4]